MANPMGHEETNFEVECTQQFRNKNTQSCNIDMKCLVRFVNKSPSKCFFHTISLRDSLMGDESVKYLCQLFKIVPSLRHVDFGLNRFLVPGSRKLSACFGLNGVANGGVCSVQSLNLEGNQGIGPIGMAAFMGQIAENTTLKSLHLGSCQACQFGWNFGMKETTEMIKKNITLESLDLSNNRIQTTQFDGADIFCDFCEALGHETSAITHLSLAGNDLGHVGTRALFDALSGKAHQVTSLNVSNCRIGVEGANFAAISLTRRQTSAFNSMRHIDISNNDITDDAMVVLTHSLWADEIGVESFVCGGNPFVSHGAHAILDAMRDCPSSALVHLDLSGASGLSGEWIARFSSFLQPSLAAVGRSWSTRRKTVLVPSNRWHATTLTKLETIDLADTDITKDDVALLHRALQRDPESGVRNTCLKHLTLPREACELMNELDRTHFLAPLPINYTPVENNTVVALLSVVRTLPADSMLPVELVGRILQFLCTCETRSVELVGEIPEDERMVQAYLQRQPAFQPPASLGAADTLQ